MSRRLMAELNARLKPLGFETVCSDETLRGPWMKFPVRQYTWRLRRLGDETGEHLGPEFVCCRTSLPVSRKGKKFAELRAWAREALSFSRRLNEEKTR